MGEPLSISLCRTSMGLFLFIVYHPSYIILLNRKYVVGFFKKTKEHLLMLLKTL